MLFTLFFVKFKDKYGCKVQTYKDILPMTYKDIRLSYKKKHFQKKRIFVVEKLKHTLLVLLGVSTRNLSFS